MAKARVENDNPMGLDPEVLGVISGLCKSYGDKNLVMVLGNAKGCVKEQQLLSTGSLAIDKAVGVMIKDEDGSIRHGIPRGRIVEIYGPESCIDKHTFIPYEVYSKDGRVRRNHKGGTIERLYSRFHGDFSETVKQGLHLQNNDSCFFVKSMDEETGIIYSNLVADVVKVGERECFEVITAGGNRLVSTLEHKYRTPGGYVELSDLVVGDTVLVHSCKRAKGRKKYFSRKAVCVKNHPTWPEKTVNGVLYKRGQWSRLCFEAYDNNMTPDEYRNFLNSDNPDFSKIKTIENGFHVHHVDENFDNNDKQNLRLIDSVEHGRYHAKKRMKNLSFIAVEDKISSILPLGKRTVYDIKCFAPNNNFIANGFVVHNSGKTTFLNHMMAETQRQGKLVAMIDMEQTWDAIYAQKLGVDVGHVVFSQPSFAEQALNILESLLRTGKFGLICFDSIAALVPQKELEGQVGDSSIGVVARLMSQMLRKVNGVVNKTDTIIVFTNQIREKIGVMFGCFHYNTRVVLEDGTTKKIGWIVNNKYDGPVKSVNMMTGEIEYKKIKNWFDNGVADNWFSVSVIKKGGNGISRCTVGDDHVFITPYGEKRLSEMKEGDDVFVSGTKYLSKTDRSVIVGSALGDGSIKISRGGLGRMRVGHGRRQREYCEWKRDILSTDLISFSNMELDVPSFETKNTDEIVWLKKYKDGGAIRFVDDELLKSIDLIALSIWYLDDGTFGGSHKKWGKGKSSIYMKKLSSDDRLKIIDRIKEITGAEFSLSNNGISASGNNSWIFQSAIAEYVPSCMKYKIHQELWNRCDSFLGWENKKAEECLIESKIVKIAKKKNARHGATHKFDIQVDGNSNYFVDNILVHNSPETTPGGNAMKFYSSVRIDIRKTSLVKSKSGDVIGNRCKIKIVKNKVAAPFKTCEFDILYNVGIDRMGELVDLATDYGIFEKKGSWFSYSGELIGQGREVSMNFLRENPQLADTIKEEIVSRMYNDVYGVSIDAEEEEGSNSESEGQK